ncbi:hypothetical protein [Leptospira johnsonii]|uniref:Uncharacterized protein n=1 Tax=Leptospira johnsonii TaxID=1917820 RepID=A0A2P2CY20_9LEPT|nr:hypothetical protein [Leptospira johnsonii]GBF37290.1 hypothetical protein LPTSP1_02700 [Leptospira johnsonii]
MKEKNEHEILFFFYSQADFLEEVWAEYKRSPAKLSCLNLVNWIFAAFPIYEDISKLLPSVISKTKLASENGNDPDFSYELKKVDINIKTPSELISIYKRVFESKQADKKKALQYSKYFWNLQKEIQEGRKGPLLVSLEETAKSIIRFNNELELELIEHYGFNFRKKLNIDIISQ